LSVRQTGRNIAMTFGTEKLEWFDGEKIEDILLVLTECTKVTDRQTDTA